MAKLWEVTQFNVRTSARDSTSDSLFANGQMQVKVIVSIKAFLLDPDENGNSDYQLTKAELEGIKLINYYSRNELTGRWTYSTTENGFAHVLPRAGAPVDPIADGTQTIGFWVSSTQITNENIAAQISQPGKDKPTTVTTTGGIFDSMVTLEAIQPVTYTTDNVSFTREDTAEGTWRIQTGSNSSTYRWDQDNYYVSSHDYPFLKVDRHQVDTTGNDNGVVRSSDMQDSFAYLKAGKNDISIFYMFDVGKEMTVRRGLYTWSGSTTYYRYAQIKVNQRVNALCLTRLLFFSGYTSWWNNWDANAWFTIYDLYGNHGHFSVRTEGQNTLSFTSRNVRSPAEGTSVGRTVKI
ncbi:hypothetical protein P170DRAFT_504818 [Aspergillus steynii IBT 23096]|uniref:Uncharacterized protein n=1 Tax=Aspergillus steynii IBT 23096 TaxID=1392250 RepID=A0A2I2GM67_9EURO|nr:uncharacterized protein P170DRAFT_504818 [Aspergillus steynii IBT 23096]PLB53949.1 hypothetical protein P170DRAFT_504818 [Aspergillus steynii IBT 23096]